jgi:hypothetical protein
MKWLKNSILLLFLSGLVIGCGDSAPTDEGRPTDENGKQTFFPTGAEEIAPGKDDSISGQRGISVSADRARTAVWEVENAWSDTDTPAAREAGIAWGEESGLTWDEKYQAWIDSLDVADSETYGSTDTFMLTTPWGKEIPAPALECAEAAIFLRITFAAWYKLPFFLEAADADGRLYFGHFGMRRDNGKYGNMPNFRDRYPDYSERAAAVRDGGEWPSDTSLRRKKIPGSFDDEQPMVGPDAHAGAYFDEVFLNKRVGHFLIITLAYFGSINLADSANTFNLKPEALRPGDVLVERWQQTGIGHTLVVMRAEEMGTTEVDGETVPQLEAEVASGSMPRRQPVWESPGASKRYFQLNATGGEGKAEYGGGLKRWRTAKNVGGRWTNVVPADYAGAWVNSSDLDAVAARLDRFGEILVELSPEQKRDVLLDIVESKRQHLRQFPASCAARIAREKAFDDLYDLMAADFDMSPEEVDAQFRTFEDYVFAELEYERSKTCCWNRSTNAMYDIIMDYNTSRQQDSEQCLAPVVFMNRDDGADGYQLFRDHAAALGRADEWVGWSADESCPWQDVAEDTPVEAEHLDFCSLPEDGGSGEEPGSETTQITADFGSADIPDNDGEGVTLTTTVEADAEIAGAVVNVDISHTWRGDLEIELVAPDGTFVVLKQTDGDSGDDLQATYEVEDLVGKDAAGEYRLIVRDLAAMDTGTVDGATLTLAVAE